MRQRISVDFDDVLYDLNYLNKKFIKENYGIDIKSKDVTSFSYYYENYPKIMELWSNFDLYSKSGPIPDAVDFFKELREICKKDDLQIVTSSFDSIKEQKDEMIKDMFDFDKVIHTKNKSQFTKNSLLIDDALHNIEDHVLTNNNHAMIFDRDYGWNRNRNLERLKKVQRVHSYEDILKAIYESKYSLM